MQNKENFYIEINLEAMIKVPSDERDELIKKLNIILTEIISNDGVLTSSASINVISEIELLFKLSRKDNWE